MLAVNAASTKSRHARAGWTVKPLNNFRTERERTMRKTLTAAALVLALSCPVFAGEMHTPAAPTPTPPQPAGATLGPTTDEVIGTGATATNADDDLQYDAVATFAQVILNLLALS
jgi:hypothetical protein